MKTYNRAEIMKAAWRLKKENTTKSFATCLRVAWCKAKHNVKRVFVDRLGTKVVPIFDLSQESAIKKILKEFSSINMTLLYNLACEKQIGWDFYHSYSNLVDC